MIMSIFLMANSCADDSKLFDYHSTKYDQSTS